MDFEVLMKKITLIGGSGFVGTYLSNYFYSNDIPFEIIDLKVSKQFPEYCKFGDVRAIETLHDTITGDLIIDLAAIHRDDVVDKNEYYNTNVVGARNIATVCSEKNISKIIFFSSVAVYGFTPIGTDENGNINPFNEYGKTKFQAEEIYRKLYLDNSNSLIIIRPTVIFGDGNRGNVYNLLYQIAFSRFIMIGSGKNKKSMAYIHNLVSFVDECIKDTKQYRIFNYVDTPDLDMNTLVECVRNTLKKKNNFKIRLPYYFGLFLAFIIDIFAICLRKRFPISRIRVKKFCSSSEFISAKNELNNFTAPYSLIEGLEKTTKNEFMSPDASQEVFYTE